jgi:hypothetical protein
MAAHPLLRRTRLSTRTVALMATFVAAGSATIGLIGSPASAGVLSTVSSTLPNCGARAAGTPFAPWGDTHSYFLMPGGSFESGTPGWTVPSAAKVVAGNETFYVNGKSDTLSLAIPTGTQVTTPTACVAMGENSVRFFVKNPGVSGAVLHVHAYVQNPLTGLVLSTGFDVKATTGPKVWAPSSRIIVPNLLGGVLGTQNVTLTFTAKGPAATWNIDDVFVDPFRSR